MDRRRFFHSAAAFTAAFRDNSTALAQSASAASRHRSPEEAAHDDDFWMQIRHAFTLDRTILNLANGSVCPAPKVVQDADARYAQLVNQAPSHYMWRVLDPGLETVRRRLARTFGCDPEEIAITRNACEALETVQLGLDLQRGDEVITTTQDYPRMITTWQQRQRRDGIVLKQVRFPVPPPSLDHLTRLIENAITPRTRVIHVCHMTNRTGQIFPIRDICRLGRERGIEVIVDGAHSFAHLPFRHEEIDCDYFGTSLHKWLCAPIGTGMLYVRKAKIPQVWPLFGAMAELKDNIRKFEQIGTNPSSHKLAIVEALDFHESIGAERKAERLRYLRRYWSRRLEPLPNVKLLHHDAPEHSCGLGAVSILNVEAGALASHLWERYRILISATGSPEEYQGLRVMPNVYTTLEELDTFCHAMEMVARKGAIPA